jgi:hypothetical protein
MASEAGSGNLAAEKLDALIGSASFWSMCGMRQCFRAFFARALNPAAQNLRRSIFFQPLTASVSTGDYSSTDYKSSPHFMHPVRWRLENSRVTEFVCANIVYANSLEIDARRFLSFGV